MRNFSARETEWLQELDGIELAPFWRRAAAFFIDVCLGYVAVCLVVAGLAYGYLGARRMVGHPMPKHVEILFNPAEIKILSSDGALSGHFESDEWVQVFNKVVVPVLYFGIVTWSGRGRSPGKRWLKIRVVSLVHRHLGLWHSMERALGYGAAALELGFGFAQFFIHPYRRCVQDRIAETIVVTERGYQAMQRKLEHPLLPDSDNTPEAREADEVLANESSA
jgi:uncharacterized RDD family membrane protein YckC